MARTLVDVHSRRRFRLRREGGGGHHDARWGWRGDCHLLQKLDAALVRRQGERRLSVPNGRVMFRKRELDWGRSLEVDWCGCVSHLREALRQGIVAEGPQRRPLQLAHRSYLSEA